MYPWPRGLGLQQGLNFSPLLLTQVSCVPVASVLWRTVARPAHLKRCQLLS